MNEKERKSCIFTIKTLMNLAYNIHGVMDVVDVDNCKKIIEMLDELPSIQPERKTGRWILDRSGSYCCSKCMEPCASYVMMRPRDKFCKMCGSRNEVME